MGSRDHIILFEFKIHNLLMPEFHFQKKKKECLNVSWFVFDYICYCNLIVMWFRTGAYVAWDWHLVSTLGHSSWAVDWHIFVHRQDNWLERSHLHLSACLVGPELCLLAYIFNYRTAIITSSPEEITKSFINLARLYVY